MFRLFKSLFKRPYDFSQWDHDQFPLGVCKTSGQKILDGVMSDQWTFVVSPEAAWLLSSSNWPFDFNVDENIKPSKISGKNMSRGAMYRFLFSEGGILAERGL